MLQLAKVAKSLCSTQVLQSTSLRLTPGETTVLIGPSGWGKSTILRLMIGLIEPDEGPVLFGGTPLTPANVMLMRRKIGYVIQDGGLFPHLSAEGNVGLLARYLGWDKAKIAARVEELAELTQLPREALARYPSQLSGGQRQRLGIMRGLMVEPGAIC